MTYHIFFSDITCVGFSYPLNFNADLVKWQFLCLRVLESSTVVTNTYQLAIAQS